MHIIALPLLRFFLELMPTKIRLSQEKRFGTVLGEIEFATWVPKEHAAFCARRAIEQGFTVWLSVDFSSAFFYGAGALSPAQTRDDFIFWLENITEPGSWGQVLFHDPAGHIRLQKFYASDD